MKFYVDLNSDIGEGFGSYKMGMDNEIMPHVTSVNLACGWHAGDPLIMNTTVQQAKTCGVAVGAHPGYPDLLGFGRRKMVITPEEAKAYMLYQLGALSAFTQIHGYPLQHMKLHGGFYNDTANTKELADAVLDGIEAYGNHIIVMILSGSYMAQEAKRRGIKVAEEVFADRGYNADGSLVNRKQPGAFVKDPDEAITRVIKIVKEKRVTAADGTEIELHADSICVHGDNPKAIEFVARIRQSLINADIAVQPLHTFIR